MDIEQLKLILETVSGVSGDAQVIAVAWLLLDKVLPVAGWLAFGYGIYRLVSRIIPVFMDDAELCRLRDKLGIGSPGYMYESERRKLFKRLNELVDAAKE